MTPDEFKAELVRQATELRAVNDRLDRMNRVADAHTAAALAGGVPSAPPPPPPGKPSPGLPGFGPRPTPATSLGNGPPLTPDRLLELARARQVERQAREEYFRREQEAIAERAGRVPRAPAVPRVRGG